MAGRRVLIVDDDPEVVHVLSSLLAKAGYLVSAARDAMEAVARAVRESPDVIILDIVMPAGGGLTALERLKRLSKTQMIPVIVASGSLDEAMERRARELGVEEFFGKPWDPGALLACIARTAGASAAG